MATKAENITENLDWRLSMHRDLVVAHDTVHPDRGDCGGVGGCLMLAAEVDAEREIIGIIERTYRAGYRVTVNLEKT